MRTLEDVRAELAAIFPPKRVYKLKPKPQSKPARAKGYNIQVPAPNVPRMPFKRVMVKLGIPMRIQLMTEAEQLHVICDAADTKYIRGILGTRNWYVVQDGKARLYKTYATPEGVLVIKLRGGV